MCKVIGNHTGITLAGSQGQFELNVFKPLIAHHSSIYRSFIRQLKKFARFCIKGIKADLKKMKLRPKQLAYMLVTALAPKIGYDNAAKIAKSALKNKPR